MLQLKDACEHCQTSLSATAPGAYICSYECTYCERCAKHEFKESCPACHDPLVLRPVRSKTESSDHLLIEQSEGIATLTLNRPNARNAYSDAMLKGVCEALDRFEVDDEVRVVVLRGAGPSFCAGGDLKAMRDRSGMFAGNPLELRNRYHRGIQGMSRRIACFEKPIIAAIHGPAIGAGLDLACMCDIRIASTSAKFGSTFVKVGLIPGDGGALFLSRVVGFSRALELILSARVIGAKEAMDIGLVHQLWSDEELDQKVGEYAAALSSRPAGALCMAKRLCYQSAPDTNIEGALQLAATMQGLVQHHPDHEAAVRALLKR